MVKIISQESYVIPLDKIERKTKRIRKRKNTRKLKKEEMLENYKRKR